MIGDDNIENWAIDLSPEMGQWPGPVERKAEMFSRLSNSFYVISSHPLPSMGRVGESGKVLGFP